MDNKFNILIIEDDDRLAEHIQVHLKRDDREFRSAGNSKDAIKELYDFLPNLVLLDLKIYEDSKNSTVPDILHGLKVAKEVSVINNRRHGQNIQIIVISGSLEHEYDRQLTDLGAHVYARLDKPGDYTDRFYEDLNRKVENAQKNPSRTEKIVVYNGISDELISGLRSVSPQLADILENFVIKSYNSKQYFECISRVASFTKCLHGEFSMSSEDIKERFKNFSKEAEDDEEKIDWLKAWDKFVKKNVLRDMDKQFAIAAIRARGKLSHDHEKPYSMGDNYTIDDAATSLQLLVPLIKKYIEFKRKK